MKFRYNIFNFSTAIVFLMAFLCLMCYYLTPFMYIPALVLFCAGFIMLSVCLIKSYIKKNKLTEDQQEAIIMELAQGEDGDRYVMLDAKHDKKQKRKNRFAKFDRLLPVILSMLVAGMFIYLLIRSLVQLF